MQLKTFTFHIGEHDEIDTDFNAMISSCIDGLLLGGWKLLSSFISYDKDFSETVKQKRYKKCLTLSREATFYA